MHKKQDIKELSRKLAKLEFINDQLITELVYIDRLMRKIGFTEGLDSLKSTAKELYENKFEDKDKDKDHPDVAA